MTVKTTKPHRQSCSSCCGTPPRYGTRRCRRCPKTPPHRYLTSRPSPRSPVGTQAKSTCPTHRRDWRRGGRRTWPAWRLPTSASPATTRCAMTAYGTASCWPLPVFPSMCITPRPWCTAISATPVWCLPPLPRSNVGWQHCGRRLPLVSAPRFGNAYGKSMTEPITTRPDLDPTLKMLLDAVPLTFTVADGVEVARQKLSLLKAPPEMLPDLRIEERTVGYGDRADIPVRIYWPPTEATD